MNVAVSTSQNNFEEQIRAELDLINRAVAEHAGANTVPDFDLRGRLYQIALKFGPLVRVQELSALQRLLNPQLNEVGLI